MDFGFTLNRNVDDITAGIGTDVLKQITKAVQSNSIESFYKIDGFCNKILMLSIENKHITHFKEYLDIVIGYYIISYEYKNNALYNKIFEICSDRSARRIRELFILLNYVFNKSKLEDKKIYNRFKLQAFNAFSQLLFEQIKRKDIQCFKLTFNQIENVFLGETISMSEFDMTLRNPAKIDTEKLKNYIEDIQTNIYVKHAILGIRYWLYFLYGNKQISLEDLTQFIRLTNQFKKRPISIEFWEMELLFNKLNSTHSTRYFNWQGWDYETHPEGESYTMPSVFDWFFCGYIIDSIQQGSIHITPHVNIDLIEVNNAPQNITLLIGTLKDKIQKIQNKDIWLEYFNKIHFNDNIKTISEQLNQISSIIEIKKANEIANEKLDINNVTEFRTKFYERWKKSKFIREIFEYFDTKKICKDKDRKLFLIGQNMFFEKAKILFLGGKHCQRIYGVEDLGAKLSHWEDDFFFQTVLKGQTEIVYPSIITGLQESIKNIKNKKYTPTIILADSTFGWMGLKTDEKWNDEKIIDSSAGSYDSIPVFFVNAGLLENRFIVADFGKAFTMLYREIENGFENELKIDIKLVSDIIAQEKLNKEPLKWKYVDGQEISEEDAITHIKTSVIVDFEVVELFEVNNSNAFEIGLIENIK